nr:reverse transcriptase domain-containing protein [Tanacetum cinerariifolium]
MIKLVLLVKSEAEQILLIENLVDHKVKVIRCDNKTEFKNREMNQFYEMKGILRQFSVARSPQQNGVLERRNKTLIEVAKTMIVDSKLPTTFWAEASSHDDGSKPLSDDEKKVDEDPRKESKYKDQEKEDNVNNTNNVNTDGNVNSVSLTVNAAGTNKVNAVGGKISIELPFDPKMSSLEDNSIFDFSSDNEDNGAVADMNNLDTTIKVSLILTTRIHKDHLLDQVIGDLQLATQTRKMSKNLEEHGFEEPKKVIHALKDPSWIEAMQEELLQSTAMAKTINEEAQLHAKVDDKKIIITESSVKRDIRLVDKEGIDCLLTSNIFGQIALMGVLDLEKTMTTQCNEIASLKRRVKKLEKKNRSRTHRRKRLYKVGLKARVESSGDEESLGEDAFKQGMRINAIDADEDITLVSATDNEMFDVDVLCGEEMLVVGQNENVVEVVDASQDEETGHWKSRNGYRNQEDEDMSRPWRDPVDHLKIFESAATIKNWPQPVWCHMFNSTLVGNARNWFSKLPRRSVDGFEELRMAFRLSFTQRKKCAKNPVELARVKQRQGNSA